MGASNTPRTARAGIRWEAAAAASWDASYRGVAVYGRSGEDVDRVDAGVRGPWPGCVQHTVVTMPE